VNGPPANPKIYHITHKDNVRRIAEAGVLWSDAKRLELNFKCELVGMSEIKRRRLQDLPVHCHTKTNVGEYVPFYFCARSIMLYILHMGNHPDLTYRGGQQPIIHLESDLHATVDWAEANHKPWAFSDRNAGTRYPNFFKSLAELSNINWQAVASANFSDAEVKEGKQAEFLLFEAFPWHLVEQIGVCDMAVAQDVKRSLEHVKHKPPISVERSWYS